MIQVRRKVETLVMIAFAVACGALALVWPQWRDDLRAQVYPQCGDQFAQEGDGQSPCVKGNGEARFCNTGDLFVACNRAHRDAEIKAAAVCPAKCPAKRIARNVVAERRRFVFDATPNRAECTVTDAFKCPKDP